MSGGHYDYLSERIRQFAEAMEVKGDPKRAAFKKLMALVAEAAHQIEWVDSGDCGPGDEHKAIDKALHFKGK